MKLVIPSGIYPISFIIQGGARDFSWMMDRLIEKKIKPEDIKSQLEDLATGNNMDSCAGFRLDFGKVQCVWVRDALNWRTIDTYIHETLHMVFGAMEHLEIEDQEAYCYLMDFLTREICKGKIPVKKETTKSND